MSRIVATDPVVTITMNTTNVPLGIASIAPDYFRGKKALHIISLAWHCHNENKLQTLAKNLKALSADLVDNQFIVIGHSQYECWLLAKHNIPTILTSDHHHCLDENIFKPVSTGIEEIEPSDAIYNARLLPYKRHELASHIQSLSLVYGNSGIEPESYKEMLQKYPHWQFINHKLGNGSYYRLDKNEIANVLAQCGVGLCLSKEEGPMRAAMEYLLCGMPVVTTRSIGGRDRYFDNNNSIYADDTPESVARAVQEMLRRNPDRDEIRQSTLVKMEFDRADMVAAINDITAEKFCVKDLFTSSKPFVGYMKYRPLDAILADIEKN